MENALIVVYFQLVEKCLEHLLEAVRILNDRYPREVINSHKMLLLNDSS